MFFSRKFWNPRNCSQRYEGLPCAKQLVKGSAEEKEYGAIDIIKTRKLKNIGSLFLDNRMQEKQVFFYDICILTEINGITYNKLPEKMVTFLPNKLLANNICMSLKFGISLIKMRENLME